MSKKTFPIYIGSSYRGMVDSIVAEAKRISPNKQHFTPQWSTKEVCDFEFWFEASSDDVKILLSDIYIFGESSIYEKSVMYDIARQAINNLELLAFK